MNAIIVDDSSLARQELRYLLNDNPNVEIIGEAANSESAQEQIEHHKPELIFLDIQMPGKDGFELLSGLNHVPEVIFVTAYNHYAIKAFDHNALDYLQKPIKKSRLEEAINRAKLRIDNRTNNKNESLKLRLDNQVFVKDGEKCWFVSLADIRLLETCGSYTRLFFNNEKPMIPKSLTYLEKRLDPEIFYRTNRQQIVNLKYINRIEPWFNSSFKLFLKDGKEIEVSRRQSIRFKELMSL
ncbi:MAG: response regulator transcription factor [Balneolaceae bacterium]|nr:response regulator transcription factor [Balneolaceae bacterium]MBO6545016.1 response regulator transcription factor [Balneolaceae bacterium]MBO6646412.1 response regulator transcription factor [Balneolaceae bacterium]